jgi:hypothetical protein
MHNHRHHLGWSDVKVGPDTESRVKDPESFAEIINVDEGIPTAHCKKPFILFYAINLALLT